MTRRRRTDFPFIISLIHKKAYTIINNVFNISFTLVLYHSIWLLNWMVCSGFSRIGDLCNMLTWTQKTSWNHWDLKLVSAQECLTMEKQMANKMKTNFRDADALLSLSEIQPNVLQTRVASISSQFVLLGKINFGLFLCVFHAAKVWRHFVKLNYTQG